MTENTSVKRLAVSALRMPDGKILRNQVLVFEEGVLQRYYPLTEEEAFTSWYGGELDYLTLTTTKTGFSWY